MKIEVSGLQFEVEDSGGTGTPVLLLMGLGGQLTHGPAAWVQALVDAGHRVIRMDNRDAGLSTHVRASGTPVIPWIALRARLGLRPRVPYRLADMAGDALGVLDALGVQRAHVVGMSMGAMIAQRLALAAPDRVISLSSLMGSSGGRGLLKPRPEVMRVGMGRTRAGDDAALMAYYIRFLKTISSRTLAPTEAQLMDVFRATAARHRPQTAATLRQLAAIVADTGRAAKLARITAPTLVLHGAEDPLVPMAGGQDTARRIPGARLEVIPDMAHDLAPAPHPEIVRRVLAVQLPFLQSVDAAQP